MKPLRILNEKVQVSAMAANGPLAPRSHHDSAGGRPSQFSRPLTQHAR
jgi:hypothetical protein